MSRDADPADAVMVWEYLIVALPEFKEATIAQGQSDSVDMLNEQGGDGWEAVGMTALRDGRVAVLMKRRADSRPQSPLR